MIVKKTGETTEFTFEDANLQECTALITLFNKLEEPEPDFEVRAIPSQLLLRSGAELDRLGRQVDLERLSLETDLEYTYRLSKHPSFMVLA